MHLFNRFPIDLDRLTVPVYTYKIQRLSFFSRYNLFLIKSMVCHNLTRKLLHVVQTFKMELEKTEKIRKEQTREWKRKENDTKYVSNYSSD